MTSAAVRQSEVTVPSRCQASFLLEKKAVVPSSYCSSSCGMTGVSFPCGGHERRAALSEDRPNKGIAVDHLPIREDKGLGWRLSAPGDPLEEVVAIAETPRL